VIRIRALASGVGGLALCGAAFDGIGIPACIDSAMAAALGVCSGFVD
jgi:oxygen-dependent protoporphyrinogen oxidase